MYLQIDDYMFIHTMVEILNAYSHGTSMHAEPLIVMCFFGNSCIVIDGEVLLET